MEVVKMAFRSKNKRGAKEIIGYKEERRADVEKY